MKKQNAIKKEAEKLEQALKQSDNNQCLVCKFTLDKELFTRQKDVCNDCLHRSDWYNIYKEEKKKTGGNSN